MSYVTSKSRFKALRKNTTISNRLAKRWRLDIKDMDNTKDVMEAFRLSMKKNYPMVPSDWEIISQYQASKLLSGFVSMNTFKKYVSKNYFRTDNEGNVYKQEVEKFKEGLELVKLLYSKKILQDVKIDNINTIVLFPKSIPKLGYSEVDQTIRALSETSKRKDFRDWMDLIDSES